MVEVKDRLENKSEGLAEQDNIEVFDTDAVDCLPDYEEMGGFDKYINFENAGTDWNNYELPKFTTVPQIVPVYHIYNMFSKYFFVIPGIQRGNVWPIEKSSEYIESLLLGLAFDPIKVIEIDIDVINNGVKSKKTIQLVFDGQQRLITLLQFYNRKFVSMKPSIRSIFGQLIKEGGFLSHDVFDDLVVACDEKRIEKPVTEFGLKLRAGNQYNNLQSRWEHTTKQEEEALGKLEMGGVLFQIIKLHDKSKLTTLFLGELYRRCNLGVPLTHEQILYATDHSYLGKVLKHINRYNKTWKKVFGKVTDLDNRFKDVFLLYRFVGLHCYSHHYRGSLKNFLELVIAKLNNNKDKENLSKEEVDRIALMINTFFNVIEKEMTDGNGEFNNIFLMGRQKKFDVALFDGLIVSFMDNYQLYLDNKLTLDRKNIEAYVSKVNEVFKTDQRDRTVGTKGLERRKEIASKILIN